MESKAGFFSWLKWRLQKVVVQTLSGHRETQIWQFRRADPHPLPAHVAGEAWRSPESIPHSPGGMTMTVSTFQQLVSWSRKVEQKIQQCRLDAWRIGPQDGRRKWWTDHPPPKQAMNGRASTTRSLGDLLTMDINHLLTGMILQVAVFWGWLLYY